MGASMVELIAPYQCLGSNQSDSNLYTDFELNEEKFHRCLKSIMIHKSKQFIMTKTISRKIYIFQNMVEVVCM